MAKNSAGNSTSTRNSASSSKNHVVSPSLRKRGRVQVVVDDSACLEPAVAEKNGIFVVPLEITNTDNEVSTSAISPLQLCATYARALERSNDAGVIAIHVAKGLSATWSNAQTAASVLDRVEVIDTAARGAGVGAALGAAAIRAAKAAAAGANLERCKAIVEDTLAHSTMWFSVPKLDSLRRGGRMSAGQAMWSDVLAMKPIVTVREGQLSVVAKCRTEAKVREKLVELALAEVGATEEAPHVLIQHADAAEAADELLAVLDDALPDQTRYKVVDLAPALVIHTGLGAVALSVISHGRGNEDINPVTDLNDASLDDIVHGRASGSRAPFITVAGKLPTWSSNRRKAIEAAERMAQGLEEVQKRDVRENSTDDDS